MQKVRSFYSCCLYAFDFRFYFTPFFGYFSSFLRSTCSLLVIRIVFIVRWQYTYIQTDCVTVSLDTCLYINLQGYNLLQLRFTTHSIRFFRFRSPLLTDSRLIFFPKGIKMFQFPSLQAPCRQVFTFKPLDIRELQFILLLIATFRS